MVAISKVQDKNDNPEYSKPQQSKDSDTRYALSRISEEQLHNAEILIRHAQPKETTCVSNGERRLRSDCGVEPYDVTLVKYINVIG